MPLPPPPGFVRIVFIAFKCLRVAIITDFVVFLFAFAEGIGGGQIVHYCFVVEDASCSVMNILSIPIFLFIALFATSSQWRLLAQAFILFVPVVLVDTLDVRFASN